MRYCPSCHSVFPNEFRTCPKDQSDLLTASELQPGMVLRGKYEILGKLGAGGMAAVYRARHLAFGEVRAIKVVNNRLADDEDFLRRFRNEAVVARRLQHPNAVRVDDLDMPRTPWSKPGMKFPTPIGRGNVTGWPAGDWSKTRPSRKVPT